jgi:hypothetical protein
MKKVKLFVALCGAPEGSPGDVVELTEAEAKNFVEQGMGEIVEEPKEKAKK